MFPVMVLQRAMPVTPPLDCVAHCVKASLFHRAIPFVSDNRIVFSQIRAVCYDNIVDFFPQARGRSIRIRLRAQSSVNESGKMRNSSLQGSIQQIHYKLHRTGDKVGEGIVYATSLL